MDNAIYVGLSSQILLEQELDIAANNLANVDTAGFKLDTMIDAADPAVTPAPGAGVAASTIVYVASAGVARDFTEGSLIQTGAVFDVAIEGKGFFQINTANGPRYTRDGRFKTDPSGRLVTQDGDGVDGGGDIVLDPKKGQPTISPNGVISQQGEIVGHLPVYTFDSLAALSKVGNNQYANSSNLTPTTSNATQVRQGMLETSNVEPIRQITRLIEINRAYDAISNMMDSTAQLSQSAVQRLGAVNPA
jgi:flagellar basal-body rod protein FlgF